MNAAALILVKPAHAGNLGAAMRVAANFGIGRLDLVRSAVRTEDPEVLNWACGAERRVECRRWDSFAEAAADYHTLAASASGRGRQNLPVVDPRQAAPMLVERGLDGVALVFGNETSGLGREDLDRCDLVIRVPTVDDYPVLNLAQAIAVIVATISMTAQEELVPTLEPAPQDEVDGLMSHLRTSLLEIGFLDPSSPQRILRKIRRLFGRAGITSNEVKILRGICRQMDWAAGSKPGRFVAGDNEDP
jgi:TrmH family RNA methyltransferase